MSVLAVETQIRNMLVAMGTATGPWKIYIGRLPEPIDRAIAVMKGTGKASHPSLLVDYPGLQILVRGGPEETGYEEAEAKIREIQDRILGIPSRPAAFPTLISVTARGSIGFIGNDESDRPIFSSNYQLIVEPEASAISHREPL